MKYDLVRNATAGYVTYSSSQSYGCSKINASTMEVQLGDIIVVCLLNTASHLNLGAVAALPGASVVHLGDCTTLPVTIDVTAGSVTKSDITVLVSLDIEGCDRNGYFQDSIKTNCSYNGFLPSTPKDNSIDVVASGQATSAIVASVVVFAVLAGIIITVVIIVIFYRVKNRRKPQAANAAVDNMVYHVPAAPYDVTKPNQAARLQNPPPRPEQVYQVLDNANSIYATLCQQVNHDVAGEYENPYCLPSLHEEELYAQLENHEIKHIPRHEVKATETLGKGQFGDVEIGIWNHFEKKKEVAIKTLNPSSSKPEDKIKFLQEAAIMAQFKHPNVIQLYGIVTDSEPIMLVLELAHNKDLKTHVSTLRLRELTNPDLPKILLAYSKQVAVGMKYLSSKSFIHRDLAARNVLVTKDFVCKIADFGLSHNLADENYYIGHGGVIPIKWTAPEAINFKKYSTASDVWSYGCLLYEIWTLGFKPFEGLGNNEAIEKIETGYRLPPPPGCPQMIYQIMINCWDPEPHSRPLFKDIYALLSCHESAALAVSDEAIQSHPQAGYLGAPLEAGEGMYLDLQRRYM